MRPKRVVVLYIVSETELSAVKMVLGCNRYEVIATSSREDVILHIAKDREISAAVLFQLDCLDEADTLAGLLMQLKRRPPILLVDVIRKHYPEKPIADVLLLGKLSIAEVLERLKFLCEKKRGPKKTVIADLELEGVLA